MNFLLSDLNYLEMFSVLSSFTNNKKSLSDRDRDLIFIKPVIELIQTQSKIAYYNKDYCAQ